MSIDLEVIIEPSNDRYMLSEEAASVADGFMPLAKELGSRLYKYVETIESDNLEELSSAEISFTFPTEEASKKFGEDIAHCFGRRDTPPDVRVDNNGEKIRVNVRIPGNGTQIQRDIS